MLAFPVVILGGLLMGWLASILQKAHYYHNVIINLVTGVASAVIFGIFFAPVLKHPSIISGYFSYGTVLIALAGAAAMLVVIDLVRRAGSR